MAELNTPPSFENLTIVEYELTPKKSAKRDRKRYDELTLDGLFTDSFLIEDVNNENAFQQKQAAPEEKSEVTDNVYAQSVLNRIIQEWMNRITLAENENPIETNPQEISKRCHEQRTCPDHACVAHNAINPRCWFVAGPRCGCRTHLGIPSCFDCQVFQSAVNNEPLSMMRETFYYLLGLYRYRIERIASLERELAVVNNRIENIQAIQKRGQLAGMDDSPFEQKLVGEIVKFSNKAESGDLTMSDQHKILTEQLGSAYLQLQSLTSELEQNNKQLEMKVTERTEELRRSNLALREAVKKSQDADRLKSEFIANVSHELRTPLNSIIGFSKVLLTGIDGEVNEGQRVDLSAIYSSGRHLLDIINSILELSKIEAGKMELHITSVNIVPIIEEIVTASQALIMGKRVKIEHRIIGKIPTLDADLTKFRQIIFNLVSNAAKFTEEGAITLRVSADDKFLTIGVSDTGIGIDKSQLDIIFERFRQVDGTATRRAGGTGLGLSIAKKFIDMHHGEIKVTSEPGKGSVFTLTLPLRQPIAK